jgi:outer membrane protein TolC
MANEAAVSQMRATWYAIEASLFDLKQQIYEVENTLSLLMGIPPTTILRSRLSDQTFPEQLSVGIPIQLLSNRPDVRSAALQLQQAFYLTEEARAALYPSLVLNGNLGWTNNAGNIILNPGGLLLAGIASLTQPVFKQGALKANLKITKAQQEQARLAFQQSILNAATEVINALKQIETAQAKTIFRYQQITALKTTVQSTELLMRHGSSTYLEVLTAKQGLLTAQLDEINDRFEEIQGIMKLYHALGGGGSNEGRSLAGASGMADRVRHDGLATVSGNTSIPSPDYFLFYRL